MGIGEIIGVTLVCIAVMLPVCIYIAVEYVGPFLDKIARNLGRK